MLWTNLLASRSTTIGWHCCTYQDNPRSENISLRHLLLPPWPAAHSGSSRSAHHGSPRNQLCSRHDFLNLDVWFDGSSSTSCRSCMWVISILLSLMKSQCSGFSTSTMPQGYCLPLTFLPATSTIALAPQTANGILSLNWATWSEKEKK